MQNSTSQENSTSLTETQRLCPRCNKVLDYLNKYNCKQAIKANRICRQCANNDPKLIQQRRERFTGANSPRFGKPGTFLGKRHTEECKQKASQERKGIPLKPEVKVKVLAGLERARKINEANGNPSPYDWWVIKYGKEEADKKMSAWKIEQSINSSGKNNPMYGKPAPKKSGRGWKGWYNGFYFRSLRELSYMIILDENNIRWQSAERKIFTIEYTDYNGKPRTYRPDFLVGENKLVEIKPIRLQSSPLIKLKTAAAILFCQKNNLTFEIVDIEISKEKIMKYLEGGSVVFEKGYLEKFLAY